MIVSIRGEVERTAATMIVAVAHGIVTSTATMASHTRRNMGQG
jgi:hypothetical protein